LKSIKSHSLTLENPLQPPLKKGEPDPIAPFLRGVRGDSLRYTGNKINFSNTLLGSDRSTSIIPDGGDFPKERLRQRTIASYSEFWIGLHRYMNYQKLLKILAFTLCGITIICDTALANISTTTLAQQHLAQVPKIDTLIIPGKSVGKINKSTTYIDLVKLYGKQRLTAKKVYGAEGQVEFAGTLITLGKNRYLTVVWKDKTKKQILWIIVQDPAWKTIEGLGVGTSLAKLRQIIGEFKITGLYWDYGNSVIDLSPAKQAKFTGLMLNVDVDPQAAKKFPKDVQAVMGDRVTLPASSPRWKRLKMSVSLINVYFTKPSL
jgi:hypothetical protein